MMIWYITPLNFKEAQDKILLFKTRPVSLQEGKFKNILGDIQR